MHPALTSIAPCARSVRARRTNARLLLDLERHGTSRSTTRRSKRCFSSPRSRRRQPRRRERRRAEVLRLRREPAPHRLSTHLHHSFGPRRRGAHQIDTMRIIALVDCEIDVILRSRHQSFSDDSRVPCRVYGADRWISADSSEGFREFVVEQIGRRLAVPSPPSRLRFRLGLCARRELDVHRIARSFASTSSASMS